MATTSKTKDKTKPLTLLNLPGVGPAVLEKLQKLNIHSLSDLLYHLPMRYEDRSKTTPLNQLRGGEAVLVNGIIKSSHIQSGRTRKFLIVHIHDEHAALTLRFFNFYPAQQNSFKNGRMIQCYGEVKFGHNGYEMIHPEYRFDTTPQNLSHYTPIYPLTEGVSQKLMQQITRTAVTLLQQEKITLENSLPAGILPAQYNVDLPAVIRFLHEPTLQENLQQLNEFTHPAQQRLILEELISHQLSLRISREQIRQVQAHACQHNHWVEKLYQQLPFKLTDAQQKVISEIRADMQQNQPMLRLLQGDVGSGKTVVAACAAVQAIENGLQSVLLAPTEILAEQHYAKLQPWFDALGIHCEFLSSSLKSAHKNDVLQAITTGSCQMLIGTHAVFQQQVQFNKLGLMIIDEQHRFGVQQRLALKEKGQSATHAPHQLIMSATPIPRTLAQTCYADLDVSVIDQLPSGRQTIDTVVISASKREQVVARVREACLQGRQCYWVCPLIEDSELIDAQAAESTLATLKQLLPELQIGLVHGRMRGEQKDQVMQAFKNNQLHLLVATTVIEVGVDVPNASLMIIENAERLGLSQLHQLRGRVGRGSIKSACVLMYQAPLSEQTRERLQVIRDTRDGFVIAQKDLELRGFGELLGTRQTGLPRFRFAHLGRDQPLIPLVQELAAQLQSQFPAQAQQLVARWTQSQQEYQSV